MYLDYVVESILKKNYKKKKKKQYQINTAGFTSNTK